MIVFLLACILGVMLLQIAVRIVWLCIVVIAYLMGLVLAGVLWPLYALLVPARSSGRIERRGSYPEVGGSNPSGRFEP